MIDAFRKDFLRSEADWQTERKKFGRNRFGSETLSFFFVKALEAGTRGEEVIKNLSRIWRPFFFIGVLHFPRCTHYLPAPSSSFSLSLTHLPFYPSAHLSLFSLVETRIRPLWIPRRPSYLFPPTFSLSRKTRVHESSPFSSRREIENVDNNGEIDRAVSYYPIIRKRIFSDLDDMTWPPTLYYSR